MQDRVHSRPNDIELCCGLLHAAETQQQDGDDAKICNEHICHSSTGDKVVEIGGQQPAGSADDKLCMSQLKLWNEASHANHHIA